MKILVTGASGMLGANLCLRLIRDGHEINALVRREIDHPMLIGQRIRQFRGDVLDRESIRVAATGCVQAYHLAGVVSFDARDKQKMFDVNVKGTRNVLAECSQSGVSRVVVTSSTAAVGYSKTGAKPLDESAEFLSRYKMIPYMASKREAECAALEFTGLEVVVVNPSTVYGAGDIYMNTGQVFKKFKDRKINFTPPGGNSVVSVKDCVDGHIRAMDKGRPGQRYILSSVNCSFAELFKAIAHSVQAPAPQRKLPPVIGPLAYGVAILGELITSWNRIPTISRHFVTIAFRQRYFDAAKAKSELGWQPTQSLNEMISEAADFYQQQKMI